MTDGGQQEGSGSRKRGAVWLLATWMQLVIGFGLVGEGAVLYAHARAQEAGPSWLLGMVAILSGAVLSLSGIYTIYVHSRQERTPAGDLPVGGEASVPLLGALLVYKYRLLTEEQLEEALELQRKEGTGKRRIGGILLDMGLVSSADLRKALDYQRSLAGPREEAEGAVETG